jgi:hypothetical protein
MIFLEGPKHHPCGVDIIIRARVLVVKLLFDDTWNDMVRGGYRT